MEDKELSLLDAVDIIAKIRCSKCGREEIADYDADALLYFYKEGWRLKRVHCYCPYCNKKTKK